jgi:hypothetical protein
MPELVPPPPRAQLLRELRRRLGELVPGLRVAAEALLGAAEVPIDFVGIESGGRVLVVLVGGEGADLELLARAVAERAWVEPRLRDWLQLAPALGIRPEAGARALLLCPRYRPATLEAARALGSDAVWLAQYRCLRHDGGVEALLEGLIGPDAGPRPEPAPPAPIRPFPAADFRTGLSDADLGIAPDEAAEFE